MCRQPVIIQKVLTLTLHKSWWKTCILHSRISGFNVACPTCLRVSTWVTLKNIPGECLGVAAHMASSSGKLLQSNKRIASSIGKRFCIGLSSRSWWKPSLSITNVVTGKRAIILINYYNLPIQCRLYQSTSHLVKDCRKLPS
uniref:Uncharacterized protein n=1 Tax=Physcomitrium patens TaxID=3218 RepID=A0A2K1IDP3_PHYPA|nr:hypothetical protein PHYPA_029553 [Physcomitrium patens]